ncbi:hypothetical protein DH2020_016995 [Rehmannia glutinosa]|uniref:K Homology domain-containing protein n=1 Tax=Rehmannia glutinosa TaxID=99300 RepID=A0ABR0WTF5_REHGL
MSTATKAASGKIPVINTCCCTQATLPTTKVPASTVKSSSPFDKSVVGGSEGGDQSSLPKRCRPVGTWRTHLLPPLLTLPTSAPLLPEMSGLMQPSSAQSWLASQGSSSGLIVKRTIRVDIPVEQYPNFNFVGRLLGPRGNSLKRVEATTDCRVLIRGRGSIKDPTREEMMRGKPGYEHLNEPLHILVEAELPVEIIDARLMQAREILEDLLKPMDESQDFYKKQQLRELALLNGTLREESSQMSGGSVSPFHNSLGMKRAKTRG